MSPCSDEPPDNTPSPLALNSPPSAAALDSALRLIPPPLADAARAAAAVPFAVDDLADLDLAWGSPPDFQDVLTDHDAVQYLHLPPPPDHQLDLPSPNDAFALAPSATSPHSDPPLLDPASPNNDNDTDNDNGLSTLEVVTVSDPLPAASVPTLSTPRRARPPPGNPPKRARARPVASLPLPRTHSPIRIAPRNADETGIRRGAGMPARESLVAGMDSSAASPRRAAPPPDPPPGAPREGGGVLPRVGSFVAHGIPMMSMAAGSAGMYPLQHHHQHQPVFSPRGRGDGDGEAVGSAPLLNRFAPPGKAYKRMRVGEAAGLAVGGGQEMSPHRPQILPPGMPMIPPGMLSYDPSMLLVQQQMYMAAAAAFAQGVIPSMAPGGHGIHADMAHRYGGETGGNGGQTAFGRGGPPAEGVEEPQGTDSVPMGSVGRSAAGDRSENISQVLPERQEQACIDGHQTHAGQLPMEKASLRAMGEEESRRGGMQPINTQEVQASEAAQESTPEASPQTGGSGGNLVTGGSQGGSSQWDGPSSRPQRKRLVWTPELHDRFVKAIDAVGLAQAVPKVLVNIMNVEGLTTEHVKSHLQKYRNSLKKEAVEDARERGRSTASMGSLVAGMGRAGVGDAGAAGMGGSLDEGMRQYKALPNRINAFGAPVLSSTQANLEMGNGVTESGRLAPEVTGASTATQVDSPAGSAAAKGGSGQSPAQKLKESDRNHVRASDVRDVSMAENNDDAGRGKTNANGKAKMDDGSASERAGETSRTMGEAGSARGDRADSTPANAAPRHGPVKAEVDATRGEATINHDRGRNQAQRPGSSAAEQNLGGARPATSKGSWGSMSGDQKELRLELMKQKTLQMQLQLQMMVHRTIALEKKMQRESSRQDEGRTGGSGATSERSGAQGEEDKAAVDNAKQAEEGKVAMEEKKEGKDVEELATDEVKQRAENGDAEVATLLQAQMEMSKALEEQRALISEQMGEDDADADRVRAPQAGRSQEGSGGR